MPSNHRQDRSAGSFRNGDEDPSTTTSRRQLPNMANPDTSTSSLLRDLAGLSISSRKSKSRSQLSVKEPDFSTGIFSQWTSSFRKPRRKKHRRRRSSDATKEDDVDGLRKDLHHERKLLRRALREVEELRGDRDALDGQCHKITSDLKKLREKDARQSEKLSQYKKKLQNKDLALEQHRTSIKNLKSEVADRDDRIEKLTTENSKTKLNLDRLRERISRERAESARLRSIQAETKTPTTNLRQLQANYDELSAKYATSQDEIKRLSSDNVWLEKEVTRLRSGRDIARKSLAEAELQSTVQSQDIKELKKAKVDLETTRDLVQPILQVGVDIRLRNLESARDCLLKIKEAERDRAITLSGNIAAHRPNGAVDAALFEAGLVPEDYLKVATQIFEKMYQVKPTNYGCWSPMVLRMIDCQATIATVQIQHHFKKIDTSHLRAEHDRLHGFLVSRQKKLSSGEFEADKKAKQLLARIEEIMEEIVGSSRGKPKKNARAVFQPFVYEESEDEITMLENAPRVKNTETQPDEISEDASDDSKEENDDNDDDDDDENSETSDSEDEDDEDEGDTSEYDTAEQDKDGYESGSDDSTEVSGSE